MNRQHPQDTCMMLVSSRQDLFDNESVKISSQKSVKRTLSYVYRIKFNTLWEGKDQKGVGVTARRGTHIWKWRGCADTTPEIGAFRWQTKERKKRGSFSEDKRKIGGHLVRTIKKKGSFSEDFSLKKKRGSFREALT